MRRWLLASLALVLPAAAGAADAPPDWAYPAAAPNYQPPPDNGQPKHVQGSTKAYTQKDVDDFTNPPDWFPNEHPAMPDLVAHGKAPTVHACDQCHLTTGLGHPESGNLAGLPAAYIVEQLGEFRNGNRHSSLAGRSANMITFAKALTDDEVKAAAEYFQSIKPYVWTKVVETTTVPKTFVGEGNMRFASEGTAKEPIGQRIIEIPEHEEGAKVRDPHSAFIAYVPPGSVKAGETLATTGGNGKTLQCSICHGQDYKGVGNVPRLAGRSAIYIFRQLYDIQHGTRKGNAVALMQPVVQKLSEADMLQLAAFMASRQP
ncbi:MAG TPA: c-type cytochrome [Micropepsaceae bacterium]|nr:c-type cytochrome [Micropepsaceae bacterium]